MELNNFNHTEMSENSAESIEYVSQNSLEIDGEPPAKRAKSLWSILAPTNKESLFYEIVSAKNRVVPVYVWMEMYEADQKKALHNLIQLFLDVASYQNVKISAFLLNSEYRDIVPYIENKISPALKETGSYFLKMDSNKFSVAIGKLSNFMVVLVEQCFRNKMLHDVLKICISLWKHMSASNVRAIRHTGVFFALHCQSGLIVVLIYLIKRLQKLRELAHSTGSEEDKTRIQENREEHMSYYKHINTFIVYIERAIFERNFFLNDLGLGIMRAQCITELGKWMDILPERYLTGDQLNNLLKSLKDGDKRVRFAALQVLGSMLYKPENKDKLQSNIRNISVQLLERVKDVDIKVAAMAARLAALVHLMHKRLSNNGRDLLLLEVYSMHHELALQCGRFLTTLLRDNSKPPDVLLKLINFHEILSKRDETLSDKIPLLINSIFDQMPELSNIQLNIKVLRMLKTHAEGTDRQVELLLEFFKESMQLAILGRCSLERVGCKKRAVPMAKKVADELSSVLVEMKKAGITALQMYPFLMLIKYFHDEDKGKVAVTTPGNKKRRRVSVLNK